MSREQLRRELQPLNLNLQMVHQLAEVAGVQFMDPQEELKSGVVGDIIHLKGYGASMAVSPELSEDAQAHVTAHLLGHFALGHTKEESQVWIKWIRSSGDEGISCLEPSFDDEAIIVQEREAEKWADKILKDRAFYQEEKVRLAKDKAKLK